MARNPTRRVGYPTPTAAAPPRLRTPTYGRHSEA
jgi:hypothetical protein